MFGVSMKEIDPTELSRWQTEKAGAFRLIDVRQPHETAAGMVPGATAVPLHSLPMRLEELDPADTLVVMCHSGARSAQACAFLQQRGFSEVYNLRGGIVGWASKGLPITRPQSA